MDKKELTIEEKEQPYFQELFNHMKEEHGLTLLCSEMQEIACICQSETKAEIERLNFILKATEQEGDEYIGSILDSTRWRKVEEEMLQKGEWVLTINEDGGMNIKRFGVHHVFKDVESEFEFYCVTHWMPIPKV